MCSIIVFTKNDLQKVFASTEESSEIKSETSLVSIEDWENSSAGEYPINEQSPEWKNISFCEALDACNMPKEYAKSLSTDDLSKYAVNYPFLIHILVYNSIEDGINSLKTKSTLFEELFLRPDCNAALLKEYTNMSCDYKILEEQRDMSASGYLEEIFLEAYFGLNYKNLSDEEANIFLEEYNKKYAERPEDKKYYSTSTIFYDCMTEAIGYVPENTIIDSVKNEINSKTVAKDSSFTKTVSYLVGGPYKSVCYQGYKKIKGRDIPCYKFHTGDYTPTEIADIDAKIIAANPTFVKVRSATKKHNCHSYAWYSTKETNPYWINDPSNIYTNNTDFYIKRTPSMKLASGNKMLFFSGSALQHSAILISSKKCKSKLGACGVYKTTIKEMKELYDAPNIKTYIRINK